MVFLCFDKLSVSAILKVKMKSTPNFSLIYDPQVKQHLQTIEKRYYPLIYKTIAEQLQLEPAVETRNRKPLRRPLAGIAATWEMRFGPDNRFRAFYQVNTQTQTVLVLAIGVKRGNQLVIGGEEI
jgi:mRNA-degrading endonuclease RelE of RelBE toxin-antitoxin system